MIRKASIFLISFICFVFSSLADYDLPESINKSPINWSEWEINIPIDEKLELVTRLKITVKTAFGLEYYNFTVSAILEYFHVVDFNKDGYYDIIYNGFAGVNNNGVILYENQQDKFKRILVAYGDIIEIWEADKWSKLSFKIHNYRCCNGYVSFIESYNPHLNERVKDHFSYGLSDKVAYVFGTAIPEQFTRFTPLKVISDSVGMKALPREDDAQYSYYLKERPVTDPNPYHRFFKFSGNVSVTFKKDAKGFVLAEKNDGNEKWLFVMMNYENFSESVFCTESHNNSGKFSVLGWIRSEDVEILNYFVD